VRVAVVFVYLLTYLLTPFLSPSVYAYTRLSVPYYSQVSYSFHGLTSSEVKQIKRYGCFLMALSMVLSYWDSRINPVDVWEANGKDTKIIPANIIVNRLNMKYKIALKVRKDVWSIEGTTDENGRTFVESVWAGVPLAVLYKWGYGYHAVTVVGETEAGSGPIHYMGASKTYVPTAAQLISMAERGEIAVPNEKLLLYKTIVKLNSYIPNNYWDKTLLIHDPGYRYYEMGAYIPWLANIHHTHFESRNLARWVKITR